MDISPCHLCKLKSETFACQNYSCTTLGTTTLLVGTTLWRIHFVSECNERTLGSYKDPGSFVL
jgi:hypothetical protein